MPLRDHSPRGDVQICIVIIVRACLWVVVADHSIAALRQQFFPRDDDANARRYLERRLVLAHVGQDVSHVQGAFLVFVDVEVALGTEEVRADRAVDERHALLLL